MSNKQRVLGAILVVVFVGITFCMVPKQIFVITIAVYATAFVIYFINKLKKTYKKTKKLRKEGNSD